jgi:uncharacterized protein YrrD
MSVLLRAGTLEGLPVVTLAGERVAEIKDVVFDSGRGRLVGFTLRSPGLFSRARHDTLPWTAVRGLGGDAVMVADEDALGHVDSLAGEGLPDDRDVLGNRVLTDTGVEIGTVVDVILDADRVADVVGYEVAASEALATGGQRVLIPLPDTIAVSGEHLIVPGAALDFVAQDLSGFGAAVDGFRARLREAR